MSYLAGFYKQGYALANLVRQVRVRRLAKPAFRLDHRAR